MTLADAIVQALPELRAEAEATMTSTCTIREKSTGRTTDPDTGAVMNTPGATVYSGRCRFRPASGPGGSSTAQSVGGVEVFSFDYLVAVPSSVTAIREGQRVTCDTSPDPALVGIEVQIEHVDRGDTLTARRLQCSEVA